MMKRGGFLTVACPTCGAAVGHPCVTTTGGPAGGSHAARADRYRRYQQESASAR